MRSGNHAQTWRTQQGFAYLMLLIGVAVLALASTAAVTLGAQMTRRDAEEQLLDVGLEYQRALLSYSRAAGGMSTHGPKTLEELLRDPRFPNVRRHLRRLYADPLTGSSEWGLTRDPQGFIVAIYSLAPGKPIKAQGFAREQVDFEKANTYQDWLFGLRIGVTRPLTAPAYGHATANHGG
jgi:type II secretory pathway pseudopilin PulG